MACSQLRADTESGGVQPVPRCLELAAALCAAAGTAPAAPWYRALANREEPLDADSLPRPFRRMGRSLRGCVGGNGTCPKRS